MKRLLALMLCITVWFTLGGCTPKDQTDTGNAVPPQTESNASTALPEDGLAVDVAKHEDLTVNKGGVYTFSGTKTGDGIIVNAPNQEVTLVLNGVTIENPNGPAVFVKEAESVTITVADGTVNTLTDGGTYTFQDDEATVDAAVFSRADLTINGEGVLNVNGKYQHGIVSKDTLSIASGTVKITAEGDGVQANDSVLVSGGQLEISSKDDAVHSDGSATFVGGMHTFTAGDDGVHATTELTVAGESVMLTVTQSYEALEATAVSISGGVLSLTAKDDGINAAGGTDSSAQNGRPGGDMFAKSTGKVEISGGQVYIRADGDAIDSNGTVYISGGNTVISGANRGDTAILDFDTTGEITGGAFIGTGAMGMAQNFSTSSTQGAYLLSASGQDGTEIVLTDTSGQVLLTRTADQAFSCIIVSHPLMKQGETYTLKVGETTHTLEMTATVVGGGHGMGGGFGGGHRPPNANRPDGFFPNGMPQNGIQPRT